MTSFSFNSDNGAPVCPQVMQALNDCNTGIETAYGADRWTARLNPAYSEFFEREAFVFPVGTGTAGNGLALGAVTPSYGTIFCHRDAHVLTTEGGAPEFYSGGGRMSLLEGAHNKITAKTLKRALHDHGTGNVHHMQVSTVCLTQATEAGVTYSLEELAELSAITHNAGMKLHMDGARFANALVHLDATPAEMSWKAGVDVLTFGTTKNGTMNAEAVVTFDPEIAKVLGFMHKRAGHLSSKMRYMSAQLLSYLERDLWRKNSERANSNARRVAFALSQCSGVEITHPVHINEVFAILPPALSEGLRGSGMRLRPWAVDANGHGHRLVMSYCDDLAQIELLEKACQNYTSSNLGISA
ncbi:threonine aldolase family protein [Roseibium sp. SCP14]|uniref:threonine aldolase family protein n=1 Tax=Roseibium sp. SCP14 TaxID=3141375 RepID=UPI003336F625